MVKDDSLPCSEDIAKDHHVTLNFPPPPISHYMIHFNIILPSTPTPIYFGLLNYNLFTSHLHRAIHWSRPLYSI
jgi:hypothetical protein